MSNLQACRLEYPCRLITHSLLGGGPRRRGFNALNIDLTGRGLAGGRLVRYQKLYYLSDKVARFLFEFHTEDYQELELPASASTASSGTIHKLLKTFHVWPGLVYHDTK